MRGLKKNTFYNIKIYSENDNGLSHPVILKRVSIRNKDEEQTHQKQVRLKGYTSWDKIYKMSLQKNRITRYILKLLK